MLKIFFLFILSILLIGCSGGGSSSTSVAVTTENFTITVNSDLTNTNTTENATPLGVPVDGSRNTGVDSAKLRVFNSSGDELFFDASGNIVDQGSSQDIILTPADTSVNLRIPEGSFIFQLLAYDSSANKIAFGETSATISGVSVVGIVVGSIINDISLSNPGSVEPATEIDLALTVASINSALTIPESDFSARYSISSPSGSLISESEQGIRVLMGCDDMSIYVTVEGIVAVNEFSNAPWTAVYGVKSDDILMTPATTCSTDITLDLNPPTVTMNPVLGTPSGSILNYSLDGSVDDLESGVSKVEIYEGTGGSLIYIADANLSTGIWNYSNSLTDVSPGETYTFTALAYDNADNTSTVSETYTYPINPGDLDVTCSDDGYAITPFTGSDEAYDVFIDSSDRIWLIGQVDGESAGDIVVVRYTNDCALDLDINFGSGTGRVILDLGNYEIPYAAALDLNDKLVIVGSTDLSGDIDAFVIRLDTDGNLDNTFGTGGIVTLDVAGINNDDEATDVAINNINNIVVVGKTYNASEDDSFVFVLDDSGNLDTGFDGDGIVLQDYSGSGDFDEFNAVAVHSSTNVIYAVGSAVDTFGSATQDMFITGLDTSGTEILAPIFIDGAGLEDAANDIVLDEAANAAILAGYSTQTDNDFFIAYIDSLDSAALTAWTELTDFVGNDTAYGLDIDTVNAKLVVAGSTNQATTDFALAMYDYNVGGAVLDVNFGSAGLVITDFFGESDGAFAGVAFDNELVPRPVLGGIIMDVSLDVHLGIARYVTQ